MIILGTNSIKDTGFDVANSLRFNSGSNDFLNKTNGTPTNSKKFTTSVWIKRSKLGEEFLLDSFTDTQNKEQVYFRSDDNSLVFFSRQSNSTVCSLRTSRLFRDTSAWYNIIMAIDTTQGTASNRFKIYVNGVQETSFATETYPNQNVDFHINTNNKPLIIGEYGGGGSNYNGYISEYCLIDGQQLEPDQFGEFDSDSNIWKPIDVSGLTFGDNGYYLEFKQSGTSQNSSGLGADTSGNDNHFAVNNLTAIDKMVDTPTTNYATFNPLVVGEPTATFLGYAEGNLQGSSAGGVSANTILLPTSGKWFVEYHFNNASASSDPGVGFWSIDTSQAHRWYQSSFKGLAWKYNAAVYLNGSNSFSAATFTSGDIISIAVDMDNNRVTFYKNGSAVSNLTNYSFDFTVSLGNFTVGIVDGRTASAGDTNFDMNAGQNGTFNGRKTAGGNSDGDGYGNFSMSVPSGYYALNTKNLAEYGLTNIIDQPSNYFNTKLYTGDGSSSRTISGVGFQPDFNWSKSRNSADYDHNVADSVRGGSAYYLKTNTDVAETGNPAAGYVSSFNSDGYVLTAGGSNNTNYNNNTTTYASWNLKAGTSFTNDASSTGIGTIDSAGSASNVSGFSIVSFTGTGSNGTIKHGLSTALSMVIIKRRDSSNDWRVGSDGLTNWTKHINLNTTAAQSDLASAFNSTAPTSSVFSVGTSPSTNASGGTYIAYCFASINGYSKIGGSYVGNGSSSGPFCYTGFKPSFILGKRTDSGGGWWMLDSKRPGFNLTDDYLLANDSQAEADDGSFATDFLSNGWKARATNGNFNASGGSYIYMAFAENPFVTSSGVPATAR